DRAMDEPDRRRLPGRDHARRRAGVGDRGGRRLDVPTRRGGDDPRAAARRAAAARGRRGQRGCGGRGSLHAVHGWPDGAAVGGAGGVRGDRVARRASASLARGGRWRARAARNGANGTAPAGSDAAVGRATWPARAVLPGSGMAAIDSLLRVMTLRDADAMIVAVGQSPSLRRGGNAEVLAMPAMTAAMVDGFVADVASEPVRMDLAVRGAAEVM